jgi:hypothetical protein
MRGVPMKEERLKKQRKEPVSKKENKNNHNKKFAEDTELTINPLIIT